MRRGLFVFAFAVRITIRVVHENIVVGGDEGRSPHPVILARDREFLRIVDLLRQGHDERRAEVRVVVVIVNGKRGSGG